MLGLEHVYLLMLIELHGVLRTIVEVNGWSLVVFFGALILVLLREYLLLRLLVQRVTRVVGYSLDYGAIGQR